MPQISLCGPLRKTSAFSAVNFTAKGAGKMRRTRRKLILPVSLTPLWKAAPVSINKENSSIFLLHALTTRNSQLTTKFPHLVPRSPCLLVALSFQGVQVFGCSGVPELQSGEFLSPSLTLSHNSLLTSYSTKPNAFILQTIALKPPQTCLPLTAPPRQSHGHRICKGVSGRFSSNKITH